MQGIGRSDALYLKKVIVQCFVTRKVRKLNRSAGIFGFRLFERIRIRYIRE